MNQDSVVDTEAKCFVGSREVSCPGEEQLSKTEQQTEPWDLRILPAGFMPDRRNDLVFISLLAGVIIVTFVVAVLKIKIFGKTLTEYIRPIWPFILGAVLIVVSQYLIGLPYSETLPYFLNITQVLWVLMVALSLIKLNKEENFNLGNAFFLGVMYSVIIHGLKVSIRYFFYQKTLLYVADRFIYGSLIVMLVVTVLGSLFIFLKKKGIE